MTNFTPGVVGSGADRKWKGVHHGGVHHEIHDLYCREDLSSPAGNCAGPGRVFVGHTTQLKMCCRKVV